MKQIKTLLFIIFVALIGFIIAFFKIFAAIQPAIPSSLTIQNITPTANQENMVTVKIDSGATPTTTFNYKFTDTKTAYDALKTATDSQGLTMETQTYDFGVFVKSINGFESTAKKSWIYFVNGQSGSVAADKYEVKNGDVIEWKYIPPNAE